MLVLFLNGSGLSCSSLLMTTSLTGSAILSSLASWSILSLSLAAWLLLLMLLVKIYFVKKKIKMLLQILLKKCVTKTFFERFSRSLLFFPNIWKIITSSWLRIWFLTEFDFCFVALEKSPRKCAWIMQQSYRKKLTNHGKFMVTQLRSNGILRANPHQ